METVRVSSKGRIVIPRDVRDAHHIGPGAELEIYLAGEEIRLRLVTRPVEPTTVAAGHGMLAGPKRIPDDPIRRGILSRLGARDAGTKGRG